MSDIIRNIIRQEINNLFESFEFVNDDQTFIPTVPISSTAAIAMQVYENIKRKGWGVSQSMDESGNEGNGRQKAEKLSQRAPQNFGEMKRLKAFFENNQKAVDADRQKFGVTPEQRGSKNEMTKSENILAWNLHGGDACRDWVNNALGGKHEENMKTKERLRKAGGAGNNKGMGVFQTIHDPTNTRIHR